MTRRLNSPHFPLQYRLLRFSLGDTVRLYLLRKSHAVTDRMYSIHRSRMLSRAFIMHHAPAKKIELRKKMLDYY
jgi:hypothetical protein